ncbi:NUDIX domain-containing protein [Actinomadura terrae]|uniref:NUDIX domain-containing protein n=1 Tax=Actinomadura terrae TaxID=604353 RepID=UPI001FA7108A|nr:NUDIX domain-containing protein [Actinomadura terrae]
MEPVRSAASGAAAEIIDYVDSDDRFVRSGPRGKAAAEGLYYRVAATIVHTGDGRVLVYRRPSHAAVFPGYHDVLVGGGVRAGEDYRQAAMRELAEETGLRPAVREVLRVRHDSPVGPCHLAVHLALLDGPIRAAADEMEQYRLLPLANVVSDPPQPFVPAGLETLRRLLPDLQSAASQGGGSLRDAGPAAAAAPFASALRRCRDRLAQRVAALVGPDGLVAAPCESRVLESALLLHLLESESVAPGAANRLRRHLRERIVADPPDALQCAFARLVLAEDGSGADGVVLDAVLSSFEHFSAARKQLMFQTLLAELGGADFPTSGFAAFDADRQQSWLRLEMCALKVMAAHGAGAPAAVTDQDWARLAPAVRPGPVWEGNHLARLLGLLALRHHRSHRPSVRETLGRITAELRPDGGLPFITGMDVFATAIAGNALKRTSPDGALTAFMADALAAQQHPDGGLGYTVDVGQSDVDDTSYTIEFLRAAAPLRHAAAIRGAERFLLRQRNPDGGFPTFVHGGPSEVTMTAAAVNALAADPAHRRTVERGVAFIVDRAERGAGGERSWSRTATNAAFRTALACDTLTTHAPASLRTAAAGHRRRTAGHLTETQGTDGGWGHDPGDPSDPISTAYAVIALTSMPQRTGALHRALSYLAEQQQPHGGYHSRPDQAGPRPLLYNAPVLADVCVLLAFAHAVPLPHWYAAP